MTQLIEIFLTFAKISLLSFGGGWTMLAILEREVMAHHWMNPEEYAKVIYLTATTPGPNAISSATIVGRHIAGPGGMIAAVLGIILPPMVLMLSIYTIFIKYGENVYLKSVLKGIAPVIVALICWMAWKIGFPVFKDFNVFVILIGAASLTLLFVGVHPGWLILGGGLAGLALLR